MFVRDSGGTAYRRTGNWRTTQMERDNGKRAGRRTGGRQLRIGGRQTGGTSTGRNSRMGTRQTAEWHSRCGQNPISQRARRGCRCSQALHTSRSTIQGTCFRMYYSLCMRTACAVVCFKFPMATPAARVISSSFFVAGRACVFEPAARIGKGVYSGPECGRWAYAVRAGGAFTQTIIPVFHRAPGQGPLVGDGRDALRV